MRSILRLTIVAGALVAAGCSDGTGPDEAGLSREDAIRIAAQFSATSSDKLGIPGASRAPAASLTRSGSDQLRGSKVFVVPCALGGTTTIDMTFNLSVDAETQSGSLETEGTLVPTGCGVRLEEGSVTLGGEPGLTVASEFAWAGGQQTRPLRVTQSGGIAWARDSGESGTCEVNLVAVTDLLARTRTVEGTLCGFQIEEETAWTG